MQFCWVVKKAKQKTKTKKQQQKNNKKTNKQTNKQKTNKQTNKQKAKNPLEGSHSYSLYKPFLRMLVCPSLGATDRTGCVITDVVTISLRI